MHDPACKYCSKDESLMAIMIPMGEVDGFPLYLFRNQTYRGRMILAYHDHVARIADMDEETCTRFYQAVRKVAVAVQKAFNPGQTNIGMFADTVTHLHCHIVPKYEGGPDWGAMFQMNPQPEVRLEPAEYESIIGRVMAALG